MTELLDKPVFNKNNSNKPASNKNNGNKPIFGRNNSDGEIDRFNYDDIKYAKKSKKLKS